MLFVPWQVIYKYCDKSFINKPTFFNFVPQLIKKTYRAGTMWFYRFVCMRVAQVHISLMTRLGGKAWFPNLAKKIRVRLQAMQNKFMRFCLQLGNDWFNRPIIHCLIFLNFTTISVLNILIKFSALLMIMEYLCTLVTKKWNYLFLSWN